MCNGLREAHPLARFCCAEQVSNAANVAAAQLLPCPLARLPARAPARARAPVVGAVAEVADAATAAAVLAVPANSQQFGAPAPSVQLRRVLSAPVGTASISSHRPDSRMDVIGIGRWQAVYEICARRRRRPAQPPRDSHLKTFADSRCASYRQNRTVAGRTASGAYSTLLG